MLRIHEDRLSLKPGDIKVRDKFYHVVVDLIASVKKTGHPEKVRRFAARSLAVLAELVELPGVTAHHVNHYAWELLTSEARELQDPQTALRYARKADELAEGKDPDILDTLALAQFRNGQREQAVETQTRALQLLPPPEPGRRDGGREEMETRLKEFQDALKEGTQENIGKE